MGKKIEIDRDWLYEEYFIKMRTIKDISNELKCNTRTVHAHIKRSGIPLRGNYSTNDFISRDWLYNRYVVEKMSCSDIGKIIGCSSSVIKFCLHKHGIHTRSPSDAKLPKKLIANPDDTFRNREWLMKEYVEEQKSTYEISKSVGCTYMTIYNWLKKFKIPTRGVEENGSLCGELHPQWKGGISFEPYCPKFNKEFRERVRSLFEYTCIICGKRESELKQKLCVHHVEYNKQACCDGKPVHFAALCRSCHTKTNKDRDRWEDIFHRIIDEIYGGRSYYTKEEHNTRVAGKI